MKFWSLIPSNIRLGIYAFLAIASIGGALAVKYAYNDWQRLKIENKELVRLDAIKQEYIEQMAKDNQKQAEIGEKYENQIASDRNRYNAALKQLRDTKGNGCPAQEPSSGEHPTKTGDSRFYWTDDEVARDALYLASVATRQAHQLIACQAAVDLNK